MSNRNGNVNQNINYGKQGEQLLKWGGHSASLDKTKYNAKGNADSLRVATKSCDKFLFIVGNLTSKHYKFDNK